VSAGEAWMRGVRLLRQLGHRDAFLPTCGAIFRRPSQYGYHSWLCEGSRMTSTREEQPCRHAATLSGVDTSVFACQAGIVGDTLSRRREEGQSKTGRGRDRAQKRTRQEAMQSWIGRTCGP